MNYEGVIKQAKEVQEEENEINKKTITQNIFKKEMEETKMIQG